MGWGSRHSGQGELRQHITRLEEIVAEVSAAFAGTAEAETAVEGIKRSTHEAEELAARYEFTITDAGEVASLRDSSDSVPFAEQAHRSMIEATLVHQVGEILDSASELDSNLADTLRRAAAGQIDAEGDSLSEVAEAGAGQAGSPHDELLEQYNVAPDPDGITVYPRTG
ncbi:hypothetical protein [Haloechinothrix sp. LS1_15]|uniref:hypothetical protein n=1 Tax=Haloechinothrix sp. LS1_15 TaxID=2652248 RepID=UPI0029442B2E|nr:hypothetical protein [Haloechinothrix sp. LS1_15]MDV6011061.1 hypothetical protein [Haloechinothrix sp. LS1_15]